MGIRIAVKDSTAHGVLRAQRYLECDDDLLCLALQCSEMIACGIERLGSCRSAFGRCYDFWELWLRRQCSVALRNRMFNIDEESASGLGIEVFCVLAWWRCILEI